MVDLISKYLTNKDPHTIFIIRQICCNAYYIETYWSRSKEIKHDTPRDINNFILGKVVKERPECVDSVKILIDNPGTLDISYDVIRTLRTLSEYQNPLYLPKSSKVPGLSSSELDEFGEDIKTIAFGQPKEVSGKSLPQSFKGSGDDVVGPIELKRGSVKFDCTCKDDSNFVIELYESNGEDSELIVNEIGPYTGKRLEEIRTSDNYYISVVGNGWTIKLTQEITVDPAPTQTPTQTPTPTTETISRKICLKFLDDLEKMGRLFNKKGIKTTAFEMLSLIFEVSREKANKEQNMHEQITDNILDRNHEMVSKSLDEAGLPITKENVIKARLQVNSEEYNIRATDSKKTSELLKKFNFTCKEAEVKELIEKIKEEIELENFEQNLGTIPEQKLEIDNFTQLNGYEFEDYLKNLFEVLGYTTVQTPSTGDQGADLILSKDGEKIVVQAKKYAGKVSNKAVQEIAAAKNYYNADRGMVVTNSAFTKSAIELAFSNDVELWDGIKLKSIIEDLEIGKIKKGEV